MRDRVIPESNCGLTPLIPGQRDAGSTRTSTRKTFALEWVINVVVQLTIAAWLALEAGLIIRDRVRRKGSAARDRGTLWLNIIIITAASRACGGLSSRFRRSYSFGPLARQALAGFLFFGGVMELDFEKLGGLVPAIVHDRKCQARIDPPAVEENRAGPALAVITALLRPG